MRFIAKIFSFSLVLSIKFILPSTITLFWLDFFLPSTTSNASETNVESDNIIHLEEVEDEEEEMMVIVKIGGSSITIKSQYETLNNTSVEWMTNVLKDSLHERFLSPRFSSSSSSLSSSLGKEEEKEEEECKSEEEDDECRKNDSNATKKKKKVSMVVIHGAGSFGHHTAKQYGLVGRTTPPPPPIPSSSFPNEKEEKEHRHAIQGIVKARHSVQKLNSHILSSLLSHDINAINLSPCWSTPTLQSHGDGVSDGKSGITELIKSIKQALNKGIVPILHGDACPYGNAVGKDGVGILSGDTLVEAITTHWNTKDDNNYSPHRERKINHVVFITDIDKVYTCDPKIDPIRAKPLDVIEIDGTSGDIVMNEKDEEEDGSGGAGSMIEAGESLHDHDVTGGLKTKLGAAASIAKEGINVHIVQCGSISAERAIVGTNDNGGTIVRVKQ